MVGTCIESGLTHKGCLRCLDGVADGLPSGQPQSPMVGVQQCLYASVGCMWWLLVFIYFSNSIQSNVHFYVFEIRLPLS